MFTLSFQMPTDPDKNEAASLEGNKIHLRPHQTIALAACSFMILLFCCFLAFLHKPSGPQPATYGHLQTLVDLIDQWPRKCDRVYWGEKVASKDGSVAHAGTSSSPLGAINRNVQYTGRLDNRRRLFQNSSQ